MVQIILRKITFKFISALGYIQELEKTNRGAVNFKVGRRSCYRDLLILLALHISLLYDNCKLIQKHGLTVFGSCENTELIRLATRLSNWFWKAKQKIKFIKMNCSQNKHKKIINTLEVLHDLIEEAHRGMTLVSLAACPSLAGTTPG